MRVEIKEITIQFPDGTDKSMTPTDARLLMQELKALFGADVQPLSFPIYVEREQWPRWYTTTGIQGVNPPQFPLITCQAVP